MAVTTLQLHKHTLRRNLLPAEDACHSPLERWRPKFHVMPVKGWMNDPCAPGYDHANELYTLSFQWNPKAAVWGNMSWGSAVSKDLVTWTISSKPSMQPDAHDPCGVFTGTLFPGGTNAFYTSAQRLPINYQLPYHLGSEKLHHASSINSGRTWNKTSREILYAPPDGLDVTGWRDPFVGTWPAMDRVRNEKALYGMLSGGIRMKTPTIFLYRVDINPPYQWQFISLLVDFGLRFSPSPWTGNYGVSWEVASIVSLHDQEQNSRDVILLGSQGIVQDNEADLVPLSANNKSMWMCASINPDLTLRWTHGGTLDHGCFYAASGFHDPLTRDFVFFGWIFEEDLSPELTERQGWSGCLSIPRVLSLRLYRSVKVLHSDIKDITCFESRPSTKFGHDVTVLTVTPDLRLQQLRHRRLPMTFSRPHAQLEIRLSFDVSIEAKFYAFELRHSVSEKTTIAFCPRTETLTVDRSMSTTIPGVIKTSKTAPHTLFKHSDDKLETLDFHIYFDTSVLEIFVNDRTALTTRVYPSSGQCSSINTVSECETSLISHEIWSLSSSIAWE